MAEPVQRDRRTAAVAMAITARRQRALVAAPAEFGVLQEFGDEAFGGPGVGEFAFARVARGLLAIVFGDLDDGDVEGAASAAQSARSSGSGCGNPTCRPVPSARP